MPFPPSDREVYEINPLEQVICQIRYPAILKVSAEPPFEFQDTVRGEYPLYEDKTALPNNLPHPLQEGIAELMAALPISLPTGLREHHFFTEDRSRSISLTQEFVAVTDSRYTRWEAFRGIVELAEKTLQRLYSPTFYQRVGLRYVDMLDRRKIDVSGVPWSSLLNPSFLGMLGSTGLDGHVQSLTTEVLLKIPDVEKGFVRIKHGLATSQQNTEQVYVIDSDFFTERRIDSSGALRDLDIFNKWAGYLFRWAAEPSLRDALGRRKEV